MDSSKEFKNIEDPKKRVYCHICDRNISNMTQIFCQDCKKIEICVKCFADGYETQHHKRDHDYRVFSKLDFNLLEENWSAQDELLLFEGLKKFGYGNWEDIRRYIGKT